MENQQSHLFPDFQSQKQRIRRLQFILLTTTVILAAGITKVGWTSPAIMPSCGSLHSPPGRQSIFYAKAVLGFAPAQPLL